MNNQAKVLELKKKITSNDVKKTTTYKDISEASKGVLTTGQVRYACMKLHKDWKVGILHAGLGMSRTSSKFVYFYDEIGIGYKLFKNKINRHVVDIAKDKEDLKNKLEAKEAEGYKVQIIFGSDKIGSFLDKG